jgi:hypothetical protein
MMPKCTNCSKREGTINWVGELGALAYTHGMHEKWCELCVCEAQLDYAYKQTARIPELQERLIRLRKEDNDNTVNSA